MRNKVIALFGLCLLVGCVAAQKEQSSFHRSSVDPGPIDYDLPTNIPPSYEGVVFMEHTNLAPNQTLFYDIKVERSLVEEGKYFIQMWITNCTVGSNYTTQIANGPDEEFLDYFPFTATNTVQHLFHYTDWDVNNGIRYYRVRSK